MSLASTQLVSMFDNDVRLNVTGLPKDVWPIRNQLAKIPSYFIDQISQFLLETSDSLKSIINRSIVNINKVEVSQ